jgi:hypothetical protein
MGKKKKAAHACYGISARTTKSVVLGGALTLRPAPSRALKGVLLLVSPNCDVLLFKNNKKILDAWPSTLQTITHRTKAHCHLTFPVPLIPRHASEITLGFPIIAFD